MGGIVVVRYQASDDNDKTNPRCGATPHSWLQSTDQNRQSSPNKEIAAFSYRIPSAGPISFGEMRFHTISIRVAGPLDF